MMKKTILTIVLAVAYLSVNSCKKNKVSTVKIDFTQSYEDTALALANAQKKYDEAVATKMPDKIKLATEELKTAQVKYIKSKEVYVSKGGTAKTEYENDLKTSTQKLEKGLKVIPNATVAGNQINNAVKTVVGDGKTIVDAGGDKVAQATDLITKKAKLNETSQKVQSQVKSTVGKAKSDIHKTTNEAKETADKEIKKLKNDLGNIF